MIDAPAPLSACRRVTWDPRPPLSITDKRLGGRFVSRFARPTPRALVRHLSLAASIASYSFAVMPRVPRTHLKTRPRVLCVVLVNAFVYFSLFCGRRAGRVSPAAARGASPSLPLFSLRFCTICFPLGLCLFVRFGCFVSFVAARATSRA